MPLRFVMSGDSDAPLSIRAIAVASGVFANFFLSLTTPQLFRSAKEIRRSTTHHAPLITATCRN